MSLRLSRREMELVGQTQERLLARLEFTREDEWKKSVAGAICALLGTDQTVIMIPTESGPDIWTDDPLAPAHIRKYPRRLSNDPVLRSAHERSLRLRVANRSMLVDDIAGFRRSGYYNEIIRPARCFDCINSAVPGRSPGEFAAVMIYHGQQTGPRFGERGLDVMRLLYPALATGLRTAARVRRGHAASFAWLDRLAEGALVFEGVAEIYRNELARRMLEAPGAEGLIAGIRAALDATNRRSIRAALHDGTRPAPPRITVQTPGGPVTLTAARLPFGVRADRTLITLASPAAFATANPGALERLCDEYGLTPRESEVAALLLQRRTNAEIARSLGISPHTARRHTENLLAKTGLHSRRDLSKLLVSAGAGP